MERETLLKRTAIASARVQAAAIRIGEISPDVAPDLLERLRAPYGKREARVCNLMEAVAEVLDVVAPVWADTPAETPADTAPNGDDSEIPGTTGGILSAGDLPLVGEVSTETIFPTEIPGAIPPPAELLGDAAEVVVVTSEAVLDAAPAVEAPPCDEPHGGSVSITPEAPTPRTGKKNR